MRCNAPWSDCHEWSDHTPLWSSHGSWSGSWEVLWGGSCSCVSWYWASPDRRCNPISASCHPSSWRCRSPWDSWPPALSAAHSLRLPPSDPEQITGHGLEKPPHLILMTTKPEVSTKNILKGSVCISSTDARYWESHVPDLPQPIHIRCAVTVWGTRKPKVTAHVALKHSKHGRWGEHPDRCCTSMHRKTDLHAQRASHFHSQARLLCSVLALTLRPIYNKDRNYSG